MMWLKNVLKILLAPQLQLQHMNILVHEVE